MTIKKLWIKDGSKKWITWYIVSFLIILEKLVLLEAEINQLIVMIQFYRILRIKTLFFLFGPRSWSGKVAATFRNMI